MNVLEDHLNKLMIETIKKYGKQDSFPSVIDIGGKDGKYVINIAKNLTVVDLNPVEMFEHVNYVKTDVMEFNSEERFDLVVSSAFMEHFEREDGIKILLKINHLLKEGGLAVITCPNAWSLNRLLGEFMGLGKALDLSEGDKQVGHKYLYNLERLEEVVKETLDFIDSGSYFFKPLPAGEMNLLFDENAFKSFASMNSETHPHLKNYLAEIYVVAKKK